MQIKILIALLGAFLVFGQVSTAQEDGGDRLIVPQVYLDYSWVDQRTPLYYPMSDLDFNVGWGLHTGGFPAIQFGWRLTREHYSMADIQTPAGVMSGIFVDRGTEGSYVKACERFSSFWVGFGGGKKFRFYGTIGTRRFEDPLTEYVGYTTMSDTVWVGLQSVGAVRTQGHEAGVYLDYLNDKGTIQWMGRASFTLGGGNDLEKGLLWKSRFQWNAAKFPWVEAQDDFNFWVSVGAMASKSVITGPEYQGYVALTPHMKATSLESEVDRLDLFFSPRLGLSYNPSEDFTVVSLGVNLWFDMRNSGGGE